VLAAALATLYRTGASMLTSDPVYSAFCDSHSPALARIERLATRRSTAPSSTHLQR
jgi:Zn-dependent protease with chaperone function